MNRSVVVWGVAVAVLLLMLILLCIIGYMISCMKLLSKRIEGLECKVSRSEVREADLAHEVLNLYNEMCSVREDFTYHRYLSNNIVDDVQGTETKTNDTKNAGHIIQNQNLASNLIQASVDGLGAESDKKDR
ncbi:hypothetical protein DRF75_04055 [Ehrlichia minasensis]|uniref:Uncharacterized protein n=1 Tax=Ehrlichia minasensis TaxID=1242993 RepID=A0A4Q6I8Y6_9RICK|nr:hypothetical protein [Ehrlichia minasensis]RZB12467.1 hypothetical protein DRF75_04055 [Ehrlichia minasensis]